MPVQLRFNDLDGFGHVNNSVYLSFYDIGKSEYFNAVRGEVIDVDMLDVVIAHVDVDFLAPVYLTDEIEVRTTVESVGNKSFTLLQQIVDKRTEDIKCACRTVMVGFDRETNTTKVISDEWRDALERFERRSFRE